MLPVLLLGSCMVRGQDAPADEAPTLAEARIQLYATLDETQELLGGEWINQDDPNSRGCITGAGAGRTFSALRIAIAPAARAASSAASPVGSPVVSPAGSPAVSSGADLSAAVEAAWEDAGYTVDSTEIGPVSQLIGTGDGDALLIFRLSDRAMTLQGESECRPAAPR